MVESKQQEIHTKTALLNEYKTTHSQAREREMEQMRNELAHKLNEKTSDMRLMELEMQRLLAENSSLIS